MEPRQPIKRSPELTPLSRDHHTGLLLCWKIRTGIKNQTEPQRIIAYVRYAFDTHLDKHFEEEEQYVFSLLDDSDSMKAEALQQHRDISAALLTLEAATENETTLLGTFANLLDAHIRFEERELFTYIELQTPADKLSDAGNRIQELHNHTEQESWEDRFWEKKQ